MVERQDVMQNQDSIPLGSWSRKFVLAEFIALRQEIENAKSRAFKTAGFGIVVVPALSALFTLQAYRTEILILLPFVCLSIILIFLAENAAISRCGVYIFENIESNMAPEMKQWMGWETWLNGRRLRTTKNIALIGFYSLLGFYYWFTSLLAVRSLVDRFSAIDDKLSLSSFSLYSIILYSIISTYVILGLIVLVFVINKHLTKFGLQRRRLNLRHRLASIFRKFLRIKIPAHKNP